MPGVGTSGVRAGSGSTRSSEPGRRPARENSRRSAAGVKGSATLTIFFFLLAGDAQPGVRQGIQPREVDLLAALLAMPELLRIAVQAPKRLVHVPEITTFLGGE